MTDEMLRNAIVRVLHRVHPAPLRRDTLAAECEVAVGRTVSLADFEAEAGALRLAGLVDSRRDAILGAEMYFLTRAGQAEAARAFG